MVKVRNSIPHLVGFLGALGGSSEVNFLTVTRSDITVIVRVVIQFMAASRTTHGDAAIPILRFLKSALVVAVYKNHCNFQIRGMQI